MASRRRAGSSQAFGPFDDGVDRDKPGHDGAGGFASVCRAQKETQTRRHALAVVELQGLTKSYNGQVAVSNTNLKIASGEFFSLLGPSGCGKSTTLRMLAGFVTPDAGSILIDGEDIVSRPPEKRDIGIVFQNYAIFPHMNVAANIGFGLRMRKVDRATIAKKVDDALKQVGLSGYEKRYQKQLSGGEQQRVALARVLVTEPRILLLDEPLSALDKTLREEMKYWIKDLQKSLGITTIYVTHDQSEALTMSDRIGVMSKSRVVQVGTPTEIYERPADLFVTTFIGESNLLNAKVGTSTRDGLELILADGSRVTAPPREGLAPGRRVKLVIRPENVRLGDADIEGQASLTATIEARIYQGALIRYRLKAAGQEIVAEAQNHAGQRQYEPGSKVTVSWRPERTEALPVD
jgi:putative spermidine/putrescine transport system ATP-binding protein